MTPVEPWEVEVRDRWRDALDAYLARRARTAALRAELAAARTAGVALRHAKKLRRGRRAGTTSEQGDDLMGLRMTMDESGKWHETQTGPDVYPIRNSIETTTPDEPRPRCRCRGELLCARHFLQLSAEDRKAYKAVHGGPLTHGRLR